MKHTLPIVLGLLFAVAGTASASSYLSFASFGTYSITGSQLSIPTMTLGGFETTGDLGLSTLQTGSLTATLNGADLSSGFQGTAAFLDPSDSLDVSFATTSGSLSGSTFSDSGTWTYTGGTGTYANLSGEGTFAGTFNPALNDYSITTFAGTLQAVPAPSAYAFLALGVLGLAARKRRS